MKKGDVRRVQILDAAEELFLRQGYDRTSVQDILDALGMSKGGFYHYFDTKESVLRAVSERHALARFDKARSELNDARRGPIDRLNLLLSMANLFEAEDAPFAAMLLKLCYMDGDAAMNVHRRRILVEQLTPLVDAVIAAGVDDGSFHSRHPMEIGRLLVLLAVDVNDEVCALLAEQVENPDVMLKLLELLNTWRESTEQLAGAPYGSVQLFDAGRMMAAWQAALENLGPMEDRT